MVRTKKAHNSQKFVSNVNRQVEQMIKINNKTKTNKAHLGQNETKLKYAAKQDLPKRSGCRKAKMHRNNGVQQK